MCTLSVWCGLYEHSSRGNDGNFANATISQARRNILLKKASILTNTPRHGLEPQLLHLPQVYNFQSATSPHSAPTRSSVDALEQDPPVRAHLFPIRRRNATSIQQLWTTAHFIPFWVDSTTMRTHTVWLVQAVRCQV